MTDDRTAPEPADETPQVTDLVDGIPDRSANPAAWKYVLIAAAFLAWGAVLVYCAVAGGIRQ